MIITNEIGFATESCKNLSVSEEEFCYIIDYHILKVMNVTFGKVRNYEFKRYFNLIEKKWKKFKQKLKSYGLKLLISMMEVEEIVTMVVNKRLSWQKIVFSKPKFSEKSYIFDVLAADKFKKI